jgi:GT2 family glycosyltransferase
MDPAWLAAQINRKLRAFSETVSAIIPVYRPTSERLNKVIAHVINQVDEIVVTAEEGVFIPAVQDQSGKVRIVVKNERRLGYGRNTNYGARHSVGKYLLLLNDDVFLEPDAVGKLLEECSDAQAGVVAHFLTYPNGTIYHAGKVRAPGVRGWGHIDHRKYIPTIQEPCEMENVCGASVLVRRKAFYDIRGFDEDFFVYAEDDDFMLRMRREGWKIRYTPHARGIHMEHQSTQELGNINDVVGTANRLFGKKWGSYFDHNLHRIPGTFDYLPR